jgi:hypothetical protein
MGTWQKAPIRALLPRNPLKAVYLLFCCVYIDSSCVEMMAKLEFSYIVSYRPKRMVYFFSVQINYLFTFFLPQSCPLSLEST